MFISAQVTIVDEALFFNQSTMRQGKLNTVSNCDHKQAILKILVMLQY